MADNTTVDNGTLTDYNVASDEVTYSGDASQKVQLIRPVHVSGAEGSKTVTDISSTAGLMVSSISSVVDVNIDNSSTDLTVHGNVAHDGVDAGNPVKIGGYAKTSEPTNVSADGDRVNAWFSRSGALHVAIGDDGSLPTVASGIGDGFADNIAGLHTNSQMFSFDGTNWNRLRGDTTSLFARPRSVTASGTLGTNGATVTIDNNGLSLVTFHVTGTATLATAIEGFDGTAWVAAGARNVDVFGEWLSNHTGIGAAGTYAVLAGLYTQVRLRVTSYTSGSLTVRAVATTGPTPIQVVRGEVSTSLIGYISGEGVDVTGTGSAAALNVGGNIAHDAVDSGNPIKIGGIYASATLPTAVAVGDRTNLLTDQYGRPRVKADSFGGGPTVSSSASDGLSGTQILDVMDFSGSNQGPQTVAGHAFNGTSWDRQRNVAALSAAPNVDTGIVAVGIGPGYDRKTNPTGVAATNTSNAVEVLVNGADMVAFHVTTIGTTPGSMIFQTTTDDSAWATAGMVIKVSTGPDTRIEGSFVPAVDDVYLVRTTGVRRVRYKVNAAYASGTATVKVTASAGPAMVKAIDLPGAPHNIGYAITSATAQYTTTQTSTTLGPTVSSTQRMVVTSIQIQASGTTNGDVQVYFGTGAYSRGTNKAVFDGNFKVSATAASGYAQSPNVPYMGAADEELKVTTSAAINPLTVTIWYYIVAA